MAHANPTPPPPETRWKPGQSGNPGGRPKRKVITDAIVRELESQARQGGTKAEAAAKRLVQLMLTGKPHVALEAAKLVLAYVEGPPDQRVILDVVDAAREVAESRGMDPAKVVSILEALKGRRTG